MIDRLTRGLFPARGLRAIFARVGDTARMTRMLHGLSPTAAHAFAEALAAAAVLGALQKSAGRVNLQLEGDGPLRGLFVDADPEGNVRGYVRAPAVHEPGAPAEAVARALGGGGYLSVIRDLGGGQFYRSAVDRRGEPLAEVLRRWFATSEQVETAVDLAVVARGDEPLGDVAAVLVQRLPDGDGAAVEAVRRALAGGALPRALSAGGGAQEVLRAVAGEGFELLADGEIAYRCGCGPERARAAVSALGAAGVAEVLAAEGQAEVTCEFCHAHYVVGRAELEELEKRLLAAAAGPPGDRGGPAGPDGPRPRPPPRWGRATAPRATFRGPSSGRHRRPDQGGEPSPPRRRRPARAAPAPPERRPGRPRPGAGPPGRPRPPPPSPITRSAWAWQTASPCAG